MSGWAFYVLGIPAPQGSKSFKGFSKAGKPILKESSPYIKPWREKVVQAAPAVPRPLDGPIKVWMVFTVPRSASEPKRSVAPHTQPDLSKLARGVEDSITDAGLWVNDGRVCGYVRLEKVWAGYDRASLPVPGVVVVAAERAGDWADFLREQSRATVEAAWARIRGTVPAEGPPEERPLPLTDITRV